MLQVAEDVPDDHRGRRIPRPRRRAQSVSARDDARVEVSRPRPQGYQATSAKLLLVRLALLDELWVQSQAGVNEEYTVIEETHLHRPYHAFQ